MIGLIIILIQTKKVNKINFQDQQLYLIIDLIHLLPLGVTASTQDFGSWSPGSNPGGATLYVRQLRAFEDMSTRSRLFLKPPTNNLAVS